MAVNTNANSTENKFAFHKFFKHTKQMRIGRIGKVTFQIKMKKYRGKNNELMHNPIPKSY